MKLQEIKIQLERVSVVNFKLPNGKFVEPHFHVTEVGEITKHFIDCGGVERFEKKVSFQLWSADDYDHRIHPEKLLQIINLSQDKLGIGNHEVEIEYQGAESIQKYGLDYDGKDFNLTSKETACLASDACGIPEKVKVDLSNLAASTSSSCTPGGGCC
ncbi:DUF6428 family protein [Saprospiraceae bacterium]|nr:DUF6428 family protein [Saprospiraceae bacterium]